MGREGEDHPFAEARGEFHVQLTGRKLPRFLRKMGGYNRMTEEYF